MHNLIGLFARCECKHYFPQVKITRGLYIKKLKVTINATISNEDKLFGEIQYIIVLASFHSVSQSRTSYKFDYAYINL